MRRLLAVLSLALLGLLARPGVALADIAYEPEIVCSGDAIVVVGLVVALIAIGAVALVLLGRGGGKG